MELSIPDVYLKKVVEYTVYACTYIYCTLLSVPLSLSLSLFDHLSPMFVVCVGFTLPRLGSGHAARYREEKTNRGRERKAEYNREERD